MDKKPKKMNVDKYIKQLENEKCKCDHYRFTHSVIDGTCFHQDCKCTKFAKDGIIIKILKTLSIPYVK